MRLYQSQKVALKLFPKAHEFLMAYSTNTPDKPKGAFLTREGRIVAVFDQVSSNGRESRLLVEKPFAARLKTHLDPYLQITGNSLETLPQRVYWDLDDGFVLTNEDLPATVSDKEFTLFRVKNNIPLQGVDFDDEMLLNVFDDEQYVSYTKGCYLGQEIVARVHFRSKPAKRLAVKAEQELNETQKKHMTSRTQDPESGSWVGFVFHE